MTVQLEYRRHVPRASRPGSSLLRYPGHILAILSIATACGEPIDQSFSASPYDSAPDIVLRASEVIPTPNPIGDLAGVAVSPGGAVAISDLSGPAVYLHVPGGMPLEIGRPGSGPGEFLRPIAVAWIGDSILAIWDQRNARLVFSGPEIGTSSTRRIEPAGDAAGVGREEANDAREFTRRLQSAGDAVVFEWAENEHELISLADDRLKRDKHGRSEIECQGKLIVHDAADPLGRTLLAFRATPRYFRRGEVSSPPPLFAPRLVWSSGNGIAVVGYSDQPRVHAVGLNGDTIGAVEWRARRAAVTQRDRENHGVASLRENARYLKEDALAIFTQDRVKAMALALISADVAPEFTALELMSGCVLISPFESAASSDGVSDSRVLYRLDNGMVLGRIHMTGIARRGLFVGGTSLVAVVEDSLGRQLVRAFSVPAETLRECAESMDALRLRLRKSGDA